MRLYDNIGYQLLPLSDLCNALVGLVEQYLGHSFDGDGEWNDGVIGD